MTKHYLLLLNSPRGAPPRCMPAHCRIYPISFRTTITAYSMATPAAIPTTNPTTSLPTPQATAPPVNVDAGALLVLLAGWVRFADGMTVVLARVVGATWDCIEVIAAAEELGIMTTVLGAWTVVWVVMDTVLVEAELEVVD